MYSQQETLTDGILVHSGSIQSDAFGFKGVEVFDFSAVKQISMAVHQLILLIQLEQVQMVIY